MIELGVVGGGSLPVGGSSRRVVPLRANARYKVSITAGETYSAGGGMDMGIQVAESEGVGSILIEFHSTSLS